MTTTALLCPLPSPSPSHSSSFPSPALLPRLRPPPLPSLAPCRLRCRESSRHRPRCRYRWRRGDGDGEEPSEEANFDRAVELFNEGDYYRCHDVLEEIWYSAEEPLRTLLHAVLQCAVAFHHLFNQNHRGAMMELGEGLCKLRKMNFDSGPFHQFEKEIADTLEFLYLTQKELAACTNDVCVTLDGSQNSYLLLGNFAGGQELYNVCADTDGVSYVVFLPGAHSNSDIQVKQLKVKLPLLQASEEHLNECCCTSNL